MHIGNIEANQEIMNMKFDYHNEVMRGQYGTIENQLKEMDVRQENKVKALHSQIKKQTEVNETLKSQVKEMCDRQEDKDKVHNSQLQMQSELISKLCDTITRLEARFNDIHNSIEGSVMNGFIRTLRMPAAVLQNEPNGGIKEKTD
jgi:predicted RNase H-like nuclease (RuvC/YqgF family)